MNLDADDPALMARWMAVPRPCTKRERDRVRQEAKYWSDPEHKRAQARGYYRAKRAKILRARRVANLSPEQVERRRLRARLKYLRLRRKLKAKQLRYYRKNRRQINQERRLQARTVALLRAVLDLLDGRPARFHPQQTFGRCA